MTFDVDTFVMFSCFHEIFKALKTLMMYDGTHIFLFENS